MGQVQVFSDAVYGVEDDPVWGPKFTQSHSKVKLPLTPLKLKFGETLFCSVQWPGVTQLNGRRSAAGQQLSASEAYMHATHARTRFFLLKGQEVLIGVFDH